MNDSTNQRMRHILYYSPAIIYTCSAKESYAATYVSENITPLLGYSAQECLNNPKFWRDNIHPDDIGPVFDAYDSFFENGHHVHEYRFRKKDGDYVWIHDELRLIRDSVGQPVEIVGSWLDITARKATEVALRESEALFRAFFQANPVATIITSPSGLVHMVNPAFTSRTDFTAEEVVGRTSQELGFWRNPADRERMVAAIREQGFIDHLESSFYGKNNQPMTCIVSSRAIELGGEVRILSTVHDVTDQRAAEEALRTLDQAKSDFISTAAHELRTPLIAIVGYSELLEDKESALTETQRENFLSIIQNNAELLNRLVDDLLDVGRIQVGRSLGIALREAELAELIEKVVESIKLESKHHEIVVAHHNTLPERFRFDSARITQVLNNLLHNAIKYSPKGGMIKVQTMTDDEKVTLSVIDQGMGMTPQQVEHVFDRFYRADGVKNVSGGLGLGMGIVKQIVLDHGGDIFVASDLGQGTTVTFTLPVK